MESRTMPHPESRGFAPIVCVGLFATASFGQTTAGTDWSAIAPTQHLMSTPSRDLTNPVRGSISTKATTALNEQSIDEKSQVDLFFGGFGMLSAPNSIGTLENAYGEYALREVVRRPDENLSPIASPNASTEQAFEIELSDETPYQVRRILRVLFEGVEIEEARGYAEWMNELSMLDFEFLLRELSGTANDSQSEPTDSLAQQAEKQTDIRATAAYREALAQLRFLQSQREAIDHAPETLHIGLLSAESENPSRDQAVIMRVLRDAQSASPTE